MATIKLLIQSKKHTGFEMNLVLLIPSYIANNINPVPFTMYLSGLSVLVFVEHVTLTDHAIMQPSWQKH